MSDLQARWLPSGQSGLDAMERAIAAAAQSIQLQIYIFRSDAAGQRIRDGLVQASRRGVRVRVLLDAFGTLGLPTEFFVALKALGGQVRWFNPLHPLRIMNRNHRKALVCDRKLAIIGGFNIGDEYYGDGVHSGWCDLGLEFGGTLAGELAGAFDRMFVLASERPKTFARLRRTGERRRIRQGSAELLLNGPGLGKNRLKEAQLRDLAKAEIIRVITPYFLPTWGLRRRLMKLARRGGQVQLLLPAHIDVRLARYAAQALYGRLLSAGVEILEYQPQVLHAKLVLTDRAVQVGSANFNTRSLHIDYELMLRSADKRVVAQAHGLFDALAERSERVDLDRWRTERGWIDRLRQRFSYWLIARLDPLLAGWLWRRRH